MIKWKLYKLASKIPSVKNVHSSEKQDAIQQGVWDLNKREINNR